jgi:phage-related protein
LGATLTKPFEDARAAVVNNFNQAIAFIQSVPDRIQAAFSTVGDTLRQAGKNLINGLIEGARSMFPNLGQMARDAAQSIRDFLPFSPAKMGPLSGSGDTMFAGQKIIQRLAAGIQMETPTLQAATSSATGNIVFGPGSVRVGFEGAVPTPAQAQTTGMAAGRGIVNALAVRNTRLQVRTL